MKVILRNGYVNEGSVISLKGPICGGIVLEDSRGISEIAHAAVNCVEYDSNKEYNDVQRLTIQEIPDRPEITDGDD